MSLVFVELIKNIFKWERVTTLTQANGANAMLKDHIIDNWGTGHPPSKQGTFGDVEHIGTALKKVAHDTARIVLLIADPDMSALVFKKAQEKGMTGRGWVYLGYDWNNILHASKIKFPIGNIQAH